MGSCRSLSTQMKDFWEEWDQVIKPVVAGGASALTGIPPQQVMVAEEQIERKVRDVIKFWNRVAGNGVLRVGPRSLEYGDREKGTLRAGGERTFITTPILRDNAELIVTKRSGKSAAEVTVCQFRPNNRHTKLVEFSFSKGKGNEGQTIRKTLRGVKGSILVIVLDSKQVMNKFAYEVRLKKAESRRSTPRVVTRRAS